MRVIVESIMPKAGNSENANPMMTSARWFTGVTLSLSIVFGYALFLTGQQELVGDARTYVQLGARLATQGLFQFADETRTFGYPLFVALVWQLSDHLPSSIRFVAFNLQLLIFLASCLFSFHVFRRLFPKPAQSRILFALTTLNPFLLIYTGVVLSDLLSAVLIFLALILAIYPPRQSQVPRWDDRPAILMGLGFFFAGCAAMVRPANVVLGAAIAGIAVLRTWRYREFSWRAGLMMLLSFSIPFVPQVINNYKSFAQFQPLIARGLYQEQLGWGIQYLKYVSVVVSGTVAGMGYSNPFSLSSTASIVDFLRAHPLEFFATQGIHLFALFDHDYAFPYVADLMDAWYRVPLAIANYVLLFGALSGMVLWLPRILRPKQFDRFDIALAGLLLGMLVYLPGYIPIAVEPRFSLPLYLMFSPFAVFAWGQVRMRGRMLSAGLGLLLFLALNLALYFWLQTTVSVLDLTTNRPVSLGHYAWMDLRIRWDNHIELHEYGVEQKQTVMGGDALLLALHWQCDDRSRAAQVINIELMDARDRVWAQTIHDPSYRSPCLDRQWGATRVSQVALLRLPVTMPTGVYRIVASVFDENLDAYVPGYRITGEALGDHVPLVTQRVEKNKQSFTASEIFIPHPLFVDMAEMRFLGYADLPSRVQPGENVELGLFWRARAKPQRDYLVSVQMLDDLNNVLIEQTARPAEQSYPTDEWNAGEVLLDWHTLNVPVAMNTGSYTLAILLRDSTTNQIVGKTNVAKILVGQ